MPRPSQTQTGAAPKAKAAADRRRRNSFDVYLDDISSYSLMSAAEERAQAERLLELRVDLWRTMLGHGALIRPILAFVERELDEEDLPADEIAAAKAALGPSRIDPDGAPGDALQVAISALALKLVRADSDQVVSTAVQCDIDGAASKRGHCPNLGCDIDTDDPRFAALRRSIATARRKVVVARNKFICANLRLVIKVAQRYGREHMSLEDRVQEGNLGLMTAVDRFEPERGFRFSTYAAWWIRHTITRALVNRSRPVRVPAHLHTLYLKTHKAQRRLENELGRPPTTEEVAAVIGERPDKIELAERAMQMRAVGPDTPISGRDTRTISDLLTDETIPDWDEQMDMRRSAVIAEGRFGDLDGIEREVLIHRYGLGGAERMTLHGIGARKGLSRERIRQLQNRALHKLREIIEASSLPTTAVA
jgi:RNA polymerase primary sigma factor